MSTEAKPLQHNDKEEHKKLPISFTTAFSSQPYDDHIPKIQQWHK